MTAHAWTPGTRGGNPVMTCANQGCRIVWWPDRNQPKSECKGTPVESTAAEFVRAMMLGGGL